MDEIDEYGLSGGEDQEDAMEVDELDSDAMDIDVAESQVLEGPYVFKAGGTVALKQASITSMFSPLIKARARGRPRKKKSKLFVSKQPASVSVLSSAAQVSLESVGLTRTAVVADVEEPTSSGKKFQRSAAARTASQTPKTVSLVGSVLPVILVYSHNHLRHEGVDRNSREHV